MVKYASKALKISPLFLILYFIVIYVHNRSQIWKKLNSNIKHTHLPGLDPIFFVSWIMLITFFEISLIISSFYSSSLGTVAFLSYYDYETIYIYIFSGFLVGFYAFCFKHYD